MREQSLSPVSYILAYAALVVLTLLTVSLSFLELRGWHLAVGLVIGAVKALLVALIFMHLVRSSGRTWLAAGIGLLWLTILVSLVLSDYLTRRSAAY